MPLSQLVRVAHEEAAPSGYFRINGLNSIYVNLTADADANQLEVAENVRAVVGSFSENMPAGYSLTTAYDATEEIEEELDKIYFRSV